MASLRLVDCANLQILSKDAGASLDCAEAKFGSSRCLTGSRESDNQKYDQKRVMETFCPARWHYEALRESQSIGDGMDLSHRRDIGND